MNSTNYCSMIAQMIGALRQLFDNDDFLIVHDNAKFAQSVQIHSFMRRNGFLRYFLSIPPYSPDMNIIENCFAYLKNLTRRNCFDSGQTIGRRNFVHLIESIWADMPTEMIDNLYKSLPTRMDAIVRAEGYSTKY